MMPSSVQYRSAPVVGEGVVEAAEPGGELGVVVTADGGGEGGTHVGDDALGDLGLRVWPRLWPR